MAIPNLQNHHTMSRNNQLKSIIFFLSVSLIVSCTSELENQTIISSGHEQIGNDWTLRNTDVSDNNVVLDREDALVISKFTVRNFDLKIRVKTTPGAEGSLAFHTSGADGASPEGYSIFINNSEYHSGSTQKTGSLSQIRNFFVRMVNDDEWFDLGLNVRGNHITVMVNGKITGEYYEPENPLRLAGLQDMVLSGGHIILSKSGNAGNIVVSDISIEGLPGDIPKKLDNYETANEIAEQLTLLNQEGFPVIDYHGHLKDVLSVEEITQHGRNHGFNYGISENCGLNFPVTDDASLNAYYEKIKDEPVFSAMQCEGREWVTLFSPESIAQYDYIFTDALTFTDHKGRRMRLWIEEEVFVEDEEQFMDMLVEKILAILSQEPVDIYVNPTFLPEEINHNYDRLWTNERMDAVIDALVQYDIALEINARYEIPGIDFIKRARAAGVTFALGTNNAGEHDLGRLEYSIRAIREAGITPEEMFVPRPEGSKKVSSMGLPDEITG